MINIGCRSDEGLRSSSGSLAKYTAIRRASSLASRRLLTERRVRSDIIPCAAWSNYMTYVLPTETVSLSAKRWAYLDMPSFSSQSAISCTATHLSRAPTR